MLYRRILISCLENAEKKSESSKNLDHNAFDSVFNSFLLRTMGTVFL